MEHIGELQLPESRWADVGGPVHYREWAGPAEGPVFVCAHGLGGSNLNWALVAPGLASRGRVLALDLAGFGLTPMVGRGSGVGANWRLLAGFLRALDLPPIVLLGNSMGGMISMIQAAHSPETVLAMILVDTPFPRTSGLDGQFRPGTAALFAVYNSRRLGISVTRARARRFGAEGLVAESLRIAAADPTTIDPRLVALMVDLAKARETFDYAAEAFVEAAQSIFQAQVKPAKYRALVRAIRRPALVIHGERDTLVPLHAAAAAAADHDNWELVVFEGVGHIPQIEVPDRWLGAVNGWLEDYLPAALRSSASDSSMA
jgi:pimeloyl-ACP methyl ester carboxylesterase